MVVRLQVWQWLVLGLPLGLILSFLVVAAVIQIHAWGLSWIWPLIGLTFLGWRWLLVRWTRPATQQLEQVLAAVESELQTETHQLLTHRTDTPTAQQVETAIATTLLAAREDAPIWQDWPTFWQRCQTLMTTIAQIYHPEVKYPLLNIYVPQAYELLRGTVDDLDRTIQKLSPVLNQVTVGQAFQAYEVYRQLEPSVRKLWQAWNWAQWFLNPAAAVARTLSQPSSNQANQQLLVNLSQLLRETTLRNLAQQAALLYGGDHLPAAFSQQPAFPQKATISEKKTATLKEILDEAVPAANIEQQPVNVLLLGRTGAGKSSLVNTLFQAERALVDVLPNTDTISAYHWQAPTGEGLNLIDSPGYEQISRSDFREQVLAHALAADLLLLATPALDPALQMDVDLLGAIIAAVPNLPIVVAVTQVDRLRPIREWQPPYDWEWGSQPKAQNIREATLYRSEQLAQATGTTLLTLPVVTQDRAANRTAWNTDQLAIALLDNLATSKQVRLARFLRSQEARVVAAASIIDRYTWQMTTTQGLTVLLKNPILRYLSMVMTGSELLASALMSKIPVEQAPVVIGKLQMAYELFALLDAETEKPLNFDLLTLWPLLLDFDYAPDRSAWALGQALLVYWVQDQTTEQLHRAYQTHLEKA